MCGRGGEYEDVNKRPHGFKAAVIDEDQHVTVWRGECVQVRMHEDRGGEECECVMSPCDCVCVCVYGEPM